MEQGHYSVGKLISCNKFEALEEAQRTGLPMQYHYNDDFWSKLDWSSEVVKTLPSLYEERVHQLRKYDHIALFVSGGADSWNAMQSFERAGVKLDEIIVFHDASLAGWESPLSIEPLKVGIPSAKAFCDRHPETRLTVLDIAEPMSKLMNLSDNMLTQMYSPGPMTMGFPARAGYWVYFDKRFRRMFDAGKKVCFLWGMDKTLINWSGREWTFRFHDHLMQYRQKGIINPSCPVVDEFFYWSEQLPELLIKQCHVVRNCLESLTSRYVDQFPVDLNNVRGSFVMTPHRRVVSIRTLNYWLYPEWQDVFTVGKPTGTTFVSSLDSWLEKCSNEEIVQKWYKIMHKGWSMHPGRGIKLSSNAFTKPYKIPARFLASQEPQILASSNA